MTPHDFEAQLRRLDRIAALVRRAPGREAWRFEYNERPHYLHFYLRAGGRQGSAAKEFAALKALQELKIPAVRAVALLAGFTLAGRKGDAVITLGVEPAVRLSDAPASHRELLIKTIAWLKSLRNAGLGHDDLRPESFLVNDHGDLLLTDAVALTQTGLSRRQLAVLAHNAEGAISTADKLRVWRATVGKDEDLPPSNRAALWKRDRRALNLQPFDAGEWKGEFYVAASPVRWARASNAPAALEDWQREWPRLLALLRADQLDILKRDASGDILAGTVPLAGRPIDFVLKRPREKYLYRTLLAVLRRSRARRVWNKTLLLVARKIPVELPLLLMERRVMGHVVESLAIFERVPGPTLAAADLNAMRPGERETFFRRCGKILRFIERSGLTHTDAKATNWIVFEDAVTGNSPVLIDAYGIRRLTSFLELFGIRRLLRAMKQHPQYTPSDSLAICLGFAPRSLPLPEATDA